MTVKINGKGTTQPATQPTTPRSGEPLAPGYPRLTSREIRSTRLLMWITVTCAFIFALVCVVAFQLLLHYLSEGRGHGWAPPPPCFEGQSPDPCNEHGKICIDNKCVEDLDIPETCQVNDACGGPEACSCDPPLSCQANKCVDPQAVEPKADVCAKTAVLDALTQLREKCAGDFHSCKGSDVKKFIITNPDFDRLMAEFPGTLTLHFPDGKPALSGLGAAWPEDDIRNNYVKDLQPSVQALREAQHIFLIARSSPGGSKNRNYLVAVERGKLAKEFLLEALRSDENATIDDTDRMRGKFADFVLGQDKQINVSLFAEHYANRYVAWDPKHQTRLRALINQGSAAKPEDAEWRDRVINQVVFVVPVPCKLGEGAPR